MQGFKQTADYEGHGRESFDFSANESWILQTGHEASSQLTETFPEPMRDAVLRYLEPVLTQTKMTRFGRSRSLRSG
jgi:hypothetical protein